MRTIPLILCTLLVFPFWIAIYAAFRVGNFVLSTVDGAIVFAVFGILVAIFFAAGVLT